MCLYVKSKIKEPLSCCTPITVYKVFKKSCDNRYRTPVMNTEVNFFEGVVMRPRWNRTDKPKKIGLFNYNVINDGFIHSFKTVDGCEDFIRSKNVDEVGEYYIVECTIPTKTRYYDGDHYVYSCNDTVWVRCDAYASKELVLGKAVYRVIVKQQHRSRKQRDGQLWKPCKKEKLA